MPLYRLALITLLTGCATSAHRAPRVAAPAASSEDASGVWDWVYRSSDNQGDLRIEQEEWHLEQKGERLDGWYDRSVTLMSVDQRLFRCNQRLGFTKSTRVRVAGQIAGGRVTLHEIGFQATPGPCDDGARTLVAYRGQLRGSTLALRWGPEAGQILVRRSDGGQAPLLPRDPPAVRPVALAPQAPLGGTWVWELRSIDAEGDERTEREEWHLQESDAGIVGYYDRVVSRERGDGTTFSCNGKPRYASTTRYNVVGQRFGDKLSLTETDYKATRSGCDNALRRLDSYQGHLADPDSLVLSWGPGNQLLRRQR